MHTVRVAGVMQCGGWSDSVIVRDLLHLMLHFIDINAGIFCRLRVVTVTALVVQGRRRESVKGGRWDVFHQATRTICPEREQNRSNHARLHMLGAGATKSAGVVSLLC